MNLIHALTSRKDKIFEGYLQSKGRAKKKKNLAIAHSWKSLYKAAFHLLRKRYQVQDVESGGPGSGLGLLYYLWDMSM